jgi:protein-S-isoprenylcysteine O-methyltransferase Ste14
MITVNELFLLWALYGLAQTAVVLLLKLRMHRKTSDSAWATISLPFILTIFFAAGETAFIRHPTAPAITIAGLVLYGSGALTHLVSMATLGRSFSNQVELQAEHHLVTTGIYSFIRHPVYSGILHLTFSSAFMMNSLLALLPAAVVAWSVAGRIRREERFLVENLPGYREYMLRTKRLVPGIF